MNPTANLFVPLPGAPGEETITTLIRNPAFTLEQIVFRGAASPKGFRYDQDRGEWVLLLCGEADLRFESGQQVALIAGDPLPIPAHRRLRVERTSADAVWLALHFDD